MLVARQDQRLRVLRWKGTFTERDAEAVRRAEVIGWSDEEQLLCAEAPYQEVSQSVHLMQDRQLDVAFLQPFADMAGEGFPEANGNAAQLFARCHNQVCAD